MKIVVGGSGGGWWGNYVLNGTKNKTRDHTKVEVLSGHIPTGEAITAQGKWTENEYTFILGFKGKPPKTAVREALKIFEEEFFAGFSKDEYHLDAVAHFDTDDTHIHVRAPKMNLLTGTQLQLYYHKKDVSRINAIRDYINVKLDLDVSVNEKPLIAENKEMERIQKWRNEANRKPFDLTDKKIEREAKIIILNKIKTETENGNIKSFGDLKDLFSEHFGLEIKKIGYDQPKDFYYFSVAKGNGKNMRIQGDFFNPDFWQKPEEARLQQFEENKRTPKQEKIESLAALEQNLAKHRSRRVEEVTKKYAKARAKGNQERGRQEARARKHEAKGERNEHSRNSVESVRRGTRTRARDQRLERAVSQAERTDRELDNISQSVSDITATDYRIIAETRRSNKHRRSVTRGLIEVLARAKDSIKNYIVERIENERIMELTDRTRAIRTDIQTGAKSFVTKLQAGIREFVSDSPGSLDGAEADYQKAEKNDTITINNNSKTERASKKVDSLNKQNDKKLAVIKIDKSRIESSLKDEEEQPQDFMSWKP